jgi:hypothetical protein
MSEYGTVTGEAETERRLRQALDAVAAGVRTRPDAYEQALAEWRRRERRRRLTGLLLACLIFAIADGIGLWALNRSSTHPGGQDRVVFDAPAPAVPNPATHPGPHPSTPIPSTPHPSTQHPATINSLQP